MKIGATLPSLGTGTGPRALLTAAKRAEELNYDSLWVAERLLYPTNPRTPYPATPDGSLPKLYATALTPIEALTFVAGHTSRITLGTSVLIMPLHNPVMLARQLATLDVLSEGRLRVGLGQGWSADEFEAGGATLVLRGPTSSSRSSTRSGPPIRSSIRGGSSACRARPSSRSRFRSLGRRSTWRRTRRAPWSAWRS